MNHYYDHTLDRYEVFWRDEYLDDTYQEGYYYWQCMPGCLPNSDPIGPFDSFLGALNDARQGYMIDIEYIVWAICDNGTRALGLVDAIMIDADIVAIVLVPNEYDDSDMVLEWYHSSDRGYGQSIKLYIV